MEISIQSYNKTAFNHRNMAFRSIKDISKSPISDLKTGKDLLPDITLYNTGINDFRLKSLIVEKRERMIQQYPLPPEYIYTDEYGINRIKPHLFIKEIIVKPEFLRQGACREAEKKIIQLSKDEGFDGRVLLEAAPIKGTRDYIPNPALAHWANGFRFYSSALAEQMLNVLSGFSPPEYGPCGCMYYPFT